MKITKYQIPDNVKSNKTLDKVFHVLFTRTMYAEIERRSLDLDMSKGALIRCALEEYFKNLGSNKLAGTMNLTTSKARMHKYTKEI